MKSINQKASLFFSKVWQTRSNAVFNCLMNWNRTRIHRWISDENFTFSLIGRSFGNAKIKAKQNGENNFATSWLWIFWSNKRQRKSFSFSNQSQKKIVLLWMFAAESNRDLELIRLHLKCERYRDERWTCNFCIWTKNKLKSDFFSIRSFV